MGRDVAYQDIINSCKDSRPSLLITHITGGTHNLQSLTFAKNHFMQVLLVLHNLLRWLILLFGILTVVGALIGVSGRKKFTAGDSRSNFFFMLAMDIQLLIGLALYFVGAWYDRLKHLSENMKDANLRFFTMEHEIMMILAWILVHMGRVFVKKTSSSRVKFIRSLVFFGIALVIILFATPWPFKEAVARPLFRWF